MVSVQPYIRVRAARLLMSVNDAFERPLLLQEPDTMCEKQ